MADARGERRLLRHPGADVERAARAIVRAGPSPRQRAVAPDHLAAGLWLHPRADLAAADADEPCGRGRGDGPDPGRLGVRVDALVDHARRHLPTRPGAVLHYRIRSLHRGALQLARPLATAGGGLPAARGRLIHRLAAVPGLWRARHRPPRRVERHLVREEPAGRDHGAPASPPASVRPSWRRITDVSGPSPHSCAVAWCCCRPRRRP